MQTLTMSGVVPGSRGTVRTGWVLRGIAVLFLLMDAVIKLLRADPAVQATLELGYPASTVVPIGLILLGCVAVYVIPRTAVLGAVLLTGYFGGAIATHVRLGSPLFTHTLFPIYLALLVWGGLYLVDDRVRVLVGERAGRG